MIVGNSGSGKSTLAQQLGDLLSVPVIHGDKLRWQEDWTLRPKPDFKALIDEATASEEWIFDGNFTSTFNLRAARATTLIWLDMPTPLCLYSILKRVFKHHGTVRPDMPLGCLERFDLEFMAWVYNFNKHSTPKIAKLFADTKGQLVHHRFTNRQAVNQFIEQL